MKDLGGTLKNTYLAQLHSSSQHDFPSVPVGCFLARHDIFAEEQNYYKKIQSNFSSDDAKRKSKQGSSKNKKQGNWCSAKFHFRHQT